MATRSDGSAIERWWALQPWRLIVVLMVANAALTIAHWFDTEGRGSIWSMESDRGVGGIYMGGMLIAAAWLMFSAHRASGRSSYLVWAAAFVVATIDAWAELHENGGYWLAKTFNIPGALGVRGDDFAEIGVWVLLAAPLLYLLWRAYIQEDDLGRSVTHTTMLLMVVVFFFAGGMDLIHMALRGQGIWYDIAGTVEEGGQLFSISLVLAWTVVVNRDFSDPPGAERPVATSGERIG